MSGADLHTELIVGIMKAETDGEARRVVDRVLSDPVRRLAILAAMGLEVKLGGMEANHWLLVRPRREATDA